MTANVYKSLSDVNVIAINKKCGKTNDDRLRVHGQGCSVYQEGFLLPFPL